MKHIGGVLLPIYSLNSHTLYSTNIYTHEHRVYEIRDPIYLLPTKMKRKKKIATVK